MWYLPHKDAIIVINVNRMDGDQACHAKRNSQVNERHQFPF
jgi:hypothetical protein